MVTRPHTIAQDNSQENSSGALCDMHKLVAHAVRRLHDRWFQCFLKPHVQPFTDQAHDARVYTLRFGRYVTLVAECSVCGEAGGNSCMDFGKGG